ncbi:TRAP transporter small permease [Glaciecola sp. 1036]|uniref:TRAP transporter small permease n=1 Tax=Alteromonadaceae TaxID=72275 RepID=UPI003CFC1010
MKNIIEKVDQALQKLLIFLMALLFVDVMWQVISRFILERPSSFTEELARFLLIWIGLLGAAHVYRHKMHLGVDILLHKVGHRTQVLMVKTVHAMTAAFALSVLLYGGIELMLLSFHLEQFSPAMEINMGLVYFALPLSGLLFLLFAAQELFTSSKQLETETTNQELI